MKRGEATLGNHEDEKLLVAVDGSEDRWAGEHAARLAKSLGAGLFVLRIVDTHKAFRARVHYARILSELDLETRSVVERIGELAGELGVEYEERSIRSNHPRRDLVRVAEELRPTLVVVGARGTSVVDRVWEGERLRQRPQARRVPGAGRRPGRRARGGGERKRLGQRPTRGKGVHVNPQGGEACGVPGVTSGPRKTAGRR